MSGKWKYFVKKYQNFCIVSGIAGFLLAPFLWPFFLAILVNTLSLTVPVIGGNLFQLFYTLADTVIVGRTLGADALAAVGSTAIVIYLVLCFI